MQTLDASVPLSTACALLVALAAKHYLADFPLQTEWMARGKERATGWAAPLLAHAGVHGLGTLAVALAFAPALWWLGLVDVVVHGLIDRGKALVSQRARFSTTDPRFWWVMGFDQFLHHVTNVGLAAALLAA